MQNSVHLRNEPCPQCRKLGQDKNGDNLGVYDDGHCYCFKCGYFLPTSTIRRFQYREPEDTASNVGCVLPHDCDVYIPALPLAWLIKYGITSNEIVKHRIMWSEQRQMLLFPYFDRCNNLLAWQGRSFSKDAKSKWFSQGDLKTVYHILTNKKEWDNIVLVEDIVSAIKLSRYETTMPLFGNNIANRLKTLYRLTRHITIWLDPDMYKKSIVEASKAQQLGFTTSIVFSDKDPKEESDETIRSRLTQVC